jgi:hypothetical protein
VSLVAPIARSKNRWAVFASRRAETNTSNDLSELVDRSVNVAPVTGDLHIRLVDLPAVADSMAARLGGVGQQRRKAEHPPVDSHVVDLDTALGEQLLDIAVGQPEAQVPADSDNDDIGREPEPGEGRARRDRRSRAVSDSHDRSLTALAGSQSTQQSR